MSDTRERAGAAGVVVAGYHSASEIPDIQDSPL